MSIPGYFVWTRGMSGPVPQKWSRKGFAATPATIKEERESILAQHDLTAEEYELSLAELASRFPAPKVAA